MTSGDLLRAVARLSTATATGEVEGRDLDVIVMQIARAERKVLEITKQNATWTLPEFGLTETRDERTDG